MKFLVTVRDKFARAIDLKVSPWTKVRVIKDRWKESFGIPISQLRIFHHGNELLTQRNLIDYHIENDTTLFLQSTNQSRINIYGGIEPNRQCLDLINHSYQGLALGLTPTLALDGSGGTYFLRDSSRKSVAVFKPMDEEAFAPNNPRGHIGRIGQPGFRSGILSGEGHIREVAAYLMDTDSFCSVPITTRVEMHLPGRSNRNSKPQIGSLQEFVSFQEVAGDFGPGAFPVEQVHKIAILDIRIMNIDRNDANILVKRNKEEGGKLTLIPVDHGYCMPDNLEVAWCDWVWLDWPQLKQPVSDRTKRYIESIDIDADITMLRDKLSIREECLTILRLTNAVLKYGIRAGLNLYQIATILCRDDIEKPSSLEVMYKQAQLLANSNIEKKHTSPKHTSTKPVIISPQSRHAMPRNNSSLSLREIFSCSSIPSDPPVTLPRSTTPDFLISQGSNNLSLFANLCIPKSHNQEKVFESFVKLLNPLINRFTRNQTNNQMPLPSPILGPSPSLNYINFSLSSSSSPESQSQLKELTLTPPNEQANKISFEFQNFQLTPYSNINNIPKPINTFEFLPYDISNSSEDSSSPNSPSSLLEFTMNTSRNFTSDSKSQQVDFSQSLARVNEVDENFVECK